MIRQASLRKIGAIWGIGGVVLLLGFAIYRLMPFAAELLNTPMNEWQLVVLIAWCLFMLYTEGHKAFGQQFAPRVVARAQYLARRGRWYEAMLAPLFCAGYFGAPKKRIITAYVVVAGIVSLIILVHLVPQPWRGIIDVGVILGLSYGIVCLAVYALQALRRPSDYVADPEVPPSTFSG